jgi:hypothetical protein
MNVKLTEVVSNITGVTGMAIIRAILQGQRHPLELAKLRTKLRAVPRGLGLRGAAVFAAVTVHPGAAAGTRGRESHDRGPFRSQPPGSHSSHSAHSLRWVGVRECFLEQDPVLPHKLEGFWGQALSAVFPNHFR